AMEMLESRAPSESWLLTVSFLDPKGLTDYEDAIAMLEGTGMSIESLAVRELGDDVVHSYGVDAQPGPWRDGLIARDSDEINEDQLLIVGAYGRGTTEAALEIGKRSELVVAALTTRCGLRRGPDVIEPEQVLQIWERGGGG